MGVCRIAARLVRPVWPAREAVAAPCDAWLSAPIDPPAPQAGPCRTARTLLAAAPLACLRRRSHCAGCVKRNWLFCVGGSRALIGRAPCRPGGPFASPHGRSHDATLARRIHPVTLRFLTYNIWDGGAARLDQIASVIAPVDPDVVLLNEADDRTIAEQLARELGYDCLWARGSGTKHIAL